MLSAWVSSEGILKENVKARKECVYRLAVIEVSLTGRWSK